MINLNQKIQYFKEGFFYISIKKGISLFKCEKVIDSVIKHYENIINETFIENNLSRTCSNRLQILGKKAACEHFKIKSYCKRINEVSKNKDKKINKKRICYTCRKSSEKIKKTSPKSHIYICEECVNKKKEKKKPILKKFTCSKCGKTCNLKLSYKHNIVINTIFDTKRICRDCAAKKSDKFLKNINKHKYSDSYINFLSKIN